MARAVAQLPPADLARCEDPASLWSFGWSRGRERLSDGRPDTFKGSFYANPVLDDPNGPPATEEEVRRFPGLFRPNVWPRESGGVGEEEGSTAAPPGFRAAFLRLGAVVTETGFLVARAVDATVAALRLGGGAGSAGAGAGAGAGAQGAGLEAALRASRAHKARLLHYYAPDAPDVGSAAADAGSSWCGRHTDHGSLTGLASAMFHSEEGEEGEANAGAVVPSGAPGTDPAAGLYVETRAGVEARVVIPADALAFQLGEAAQVASGGLLRATPHRVRAPRGGVGLVRCSRSTFACFLQPDAGAAMVAPAGMDEVAAVGVPRWVPGMTFGEFTEKTFADVYL